MAECNDFTEALENLVTCVICCDILTEPKTLPCLHTLCFKCIQDWNRVCKSNKKRFSCPSCKAAINLPDDVINLPTSFHHNSLIQFYNNFKNQTGNPQKLQDCASCSKSRVAVGFCFQCQGTICNECKNAHNTVNTLKDNHTVTLWNEFNKESIKNYMENKAFCQEKYHDQCILEYYCQTCLKPICQKCTVTSHIDHVKISIGEAADLACDALVNECLRIDQVVQLRNKELEVTRKNKKRIQDQVQEEIAKLYNDLGAKCKILQEKQDALLVELNKKREVEIAENDEKENMIAAALQEAVKLRDQCKTMTDMNLKHFMLERCERLKKVCKTTVKHEPMLSTPCVQTRVQYIPNPDATQILNDLDLGKIELCVTDPAQCSIECVQPTNSTKCGFVNQFSVVTRNSRGEECHTNKDLIDVNIKDKDGNDVHKEITESRPGRFAVNYRVEKPSPYNISVSIGGKTIQNSTQTIDVLEAGAEIKPVRFFQTTHSSLPLGLAINDIGDIAIVSNDLACRVSLYSAEGQYLRDFGGEGTGGCLISNPRGIAVSREGHILISDNTDDGACIKEYHSMDGRLLRTYYCQKECAFSDMCTSEQSIACLSINKQSKETSIVLFSMKTGDHLKEIKLNAPDVKTWPCYLAYDNHKYFVSFSDINSVYVFDEDGGLLYTIGEEGCQHAYVNSDRFLLFFNK